jgi:DNA-binding IclR family transcriptional regulator
MVAFSRQVDNDLQSILNTLDVLECLVREEDIDAGDLAQRLEVPECTAQRLLDAICARGLAAQDPANGRYRLGVHLFELSQMASDRFPLRRASGTVRCRRVLTSCSWSACRACPAWA